MNKIELLAPAGSFEKAKIACQNSELSDIDHFVVNNKVVEIGSGAKREQKDYKLTIEGHYTRRTLLHTEWEQYGGTMKKRKENIHLKKKRKGGTGDPLLRVGGHRRQRGGDEGH